MKKRRPGLLAFSPIDLFRPMVVGCSISRTPRLSLVVRTLLAMILIVGVVVVTAVWDHTFFVVIQDSKYLTISAGEQSFAEAWAYLYGDYLLAGIGAVFVILPPAMLAFNLLSAFTHLIDVHRHGRFIASLGLAIRATSASLWPALGLITICCALGLLLDRYGWDQTKRFIEPPPWALVIIPGVPACGLVMAWWTSRAIGAATAGFPAVEHSPRCEGCGYDLTHRPAGGLCPECALSLDDSLLPETRRPGSPWERQGGIVGWVKSVAAIVIAPRQYYGRLQLNSPIAAAHRFARWQFVLIGLGAALWAIFLCMIVAQPRPRSGEFLFFPLIGGLWAAFIAWGLHRLLMAPVLGDWIRRHALVDFGWARKVFYYESAYLWLFCLFNGLWSTWMFATDGRGLSNLTDQWLGYRLYILGIRIDEFVIFLGNGLLCCLWIWRYYIALAAIRWSNF